MFYMSGVLLCMLLVVVKRLPTGRDVWLRSDGGAVVRRVIFERYLLERIFPLPLLFVLRR